MRRLALVIGRNVDRLMAPFDDEVRYPDGDGMCEDCMDDLPERDSCEACGGTGLGFWNPHMKWDYFRVLWSGRLADAGAEIAEEVNDGMPICTMAIVDRDGWIDDYDFVAQMFGGRMTRQAERAWVEYWNEVLGGLSPATCVSLVVYHH